MGGELGVLDLKTYFFLSRGLLFPFIMKYNLLHLWHENPHNKRS